MGKNDELCNVKSVIQEMYERTDKDNVVIVAEDFLDDEYEMDEHRYSCVMNWPKDGVDDVIAECEEIYDSLIKLGKWYKETECEFGEEPSENSLKIIWNAFLNNDSKSYKNDDQLFKKVIIRAARLCKLVSLDAPPVVVAIEASYLAEAYAVSEYAESVEEIFVENY